MHKSLCTFLFKPKRDRDKERMSDRKRNIYKVGGSHLITAEAFNQVQRFLLEKKHLLVIVSALGDTTANLQSLLTLAEKGQPYQAHLDKILTFHQSLSTTLLGSAEPFERYSADDISFLEHSLTQIQKEQQCSSQLKDHILSMGEYWSTFLFSNHSTTDFVLLDAANILVVNKKNNVCEINWPLTQTLFKAFIDNNPAENYIITGYVARNLQGDKITLGFEGSDLSAALFGQLFAVDNMHFLSNVDGLYTADPHKVAQAQIISELSYEEARELVYFGGSFFHPQTINPAMEIQASIYIHNPYTDNKKNTKISLTPKKSTHKIRGMTLVDPLCLVTLSAPFLSGSMALLSDAVELLSNAGISVALITHSAVDNALCIAINQTLLKETLGCLEQRYEASLLSKTASIKIKKDCAMLTVVGEGMIGEVGCSANLLGCLANANINVLALNQGASERSISVLIDNKEALKALNVVHSGFYLSKRQLQIALLGPGNVGKAFLKQLMDNKIRLEETLQVTLNLTVLASSKKMRLGNLNGAEETLIDGLKQSALSLDMPEAIAYLKNNDSSHTVVIDCTSSEKISDLYQPFINNGFHVITPNKKVTSGRFERFQAVKESCFKHKRHFLYETNVCAGLPVIKTLQDLVATGDEIISVQGVFSGTLSYLFNEVSAGADFSKALISAYEKGLTEPDPRDDLNGLDVARKCVCLAREMGFLVELDEVTIVPILPDELMSGSLENFFSNTALIDEAFNQHIKRMKNKKNKLAYTGSISLKGHIELSVEEVDASSAFYPLKGTDNMVIFHTKRYEQYPLIIQGPGAGAEVTAAGVFADLLRLVSLTSGA